VLHEACLLQLLQHCSTQVVAQCGQVLLVGVALAQQQLQALVDQGLCGRGWVLLQRTNAQLGQCLGSLQQQQQQQQQ
jgi:hypothetical protein